MGNNFWIKLHHEILRDPKMGRMPDHLWRRTIELFLLAGQNGTDGKLPEIGDAAWALNVTEEQLEAEITELIRLGIITTDNEGGLKVKNFEKRQAKITTKDRMHAYRERQRQAAVEDGVPAEADTDDNNDGYANVTTRNTDIELDIDKESDKDQDSSNEASPPFSELPKKQQSQSMFSALADLIRIDIPTITGDMRQKINQAEKKMRDKGYTPADVADFHDYWYTLDWRGQKGQHPTLPQVRAEWGAMLQWRNNDDVAQAAAVTAERLEPTVQNEPEMDPKRAAVQAFIRHAPDFGLAAPWLNTLEYHSTPNGHDLWTGSEMAIGFLTAPSRARAVRDTCRAAGIEKPGFVGAE